MQFIMLLFHVFVCVAIIALVLMQQGKGADIGAAFGAGASQTVFGSGGAGSFLMKVTGGLAIVFFATCIGLGYLIAHQNVQTGFQLPTTKAKTTDSIVIPGQLNKNAPAPK